MKLTKIGLTVLSSVVLIGTVTVSEANACGGYEKTEAPKTSVLNEPLAGYIAMGVMASSVIINEIAKRKGIRDV